MVQLACWANPGDKNCVAKVKEFLDAHPEVTGIKVHPCHDRWPVAEEVLGPVLNVALERGLYVITHTQTTPGHSSICFAPLLRKRRELRFILGHSAKMEEAAFMASAFKNCYAEPSWLGFFSLLFEMTERLGGHNKILAGTDGPGWFANFDKDPFEDVVEKARGYLPSEREVEMFCYGNAAEFFGL